MIKINDNPLYKYVYKNEDVLPVQIHKVTRITEYEASSLLKKYKDAGFVVFELLNDNPSQDALLSLAKQLVLGEPYVPYIYSTEKNIYDETGLNIIKVKDGIHRAFQTNNEQKIHCDGTVEVIGKIKTTILLCAKAASGGGETIIFNSVAALYNLLRIENLEPILSSLFNLNALKRVAANGAKEEYIGPAFTIRSGEIISRFSLDNTCDWSYGFEKVKFLREAYSLLTEMITLKSPFYIETRLKENQGIIIANDKISHGRKGFIDNDPTREMIRGLFINKLEFNSK